MFIEPVQTLRGFYGLKDYQAYPTLSVVLFTYVIHHTFLRLWQLLPWSVAQQTHPEREVRRAGCLAVNMRPPTPSNMRAPSATFQCALCPRKYTRAFNLRNHLRTHTEERPFVCGVCGKAFNRDHDRKTHEQLHSGEKLWVCGGTLKNGEHWGCGWRYARKSNLQRHFRSDLGRRCIKPLRDEESAERNATAGLMDVARRQETSYILDLTQLQPHQANAEHSASTTLTEIARTLDDGDFSGVPPARPDISQAATSTSIYNSSTKLDWHEWDR